MNCNVIVKTEIYQKGACAYFLRFTAGDTS